MTKERNYLKDIKLYSNNYVTFVNGAKGKIIGKGKIDYHGIPFFNHVLLVNGITTNLISISQLYDQDLCVKFNSVECIIIYKKTY